MATPALRNASSPPNLVRRLSIDLIYIQLCNPTSLTKILVERININQINQLSHVKILHIVLIRSIRFWNVQTEDKVTFLGVSASTLPKRMSEQMNLPTGVHLSVDQVSAESPADSAGLKLFDILLKFDDQILVNSAQLKAWQE